MAKPVPRWFMILAVVLAISAQALEGSLTIVELGIVVIVAVLLFGTSLPERVGGGFSPKVRSRAKAAMFTASIMAMLIMSAVGSQKSVVGWIGFCSMLPAVAFFCYRGCVEDEAEGPQD
jgi:hypothetical protein